MLLVKNATVYSPDYLGRKDLFVLEDFPYLASNSTT